MQKFRPRYIGLSVSPWMITGAALILMVIVLVMAFRNYNREKEYMVDILVAKGSALIKSFEAGTRTGMRSMGWSGSHLQDLMEETVLQSDVLYLAITDTDGRVLAHSDPERIGAELPSGRISDRNSGNRAVGQGSDWRLALSEEGMETFEVYKDYKPFVSRKGRHPHMENGRGMPHRDAWWAPDATGKNSRLIVIGFDKTPFETARREDLRNTVITSSILLLLGFAGFLILFVTQNYRETHRKLQDTSAMANEVVASLPIGLIVTDEAGRIVMENAAAASITGLAPRGTRGRPINEVLPRNLAVLTEGKRRDARMIEQEMECVFGDREPISLSVSVAPVVNEDGVFIGSIIAFRDLTEIKSLQRILQRKEKLAAIGGLAAGVAHEIRNPLSSIKGMATYFRGRFVEDPDAKEAAEVMVRETDRLNRVISELLEFARPPEIHAAPEDVNDILEHAICLIRADAEEKDILPQLFRGDGLPAVRIDADRFVQCLLNLYLNSIQAMEYGGKLNVSSRPSADGGVEIHVEDTGPGISSGDINQIFDPYFTTKAKGTGLGLAIVHKIVESHGGKITVKSRESGGTAFVIWLPPATGGASKGDLTHE